MTQGCWRIAYIMNRVPHCLSVTEFDMAAVQGLCMKESTSQGKPLRVKSLTVFYFGYRNATSEKNY